MRNKEIPQNATLTEWQFIKHLNSFAFTVAGNIYVTSDWCQSQQQHTPRNLANNA